MVGCFQTIMKFVNDEKLLVRNGIIDKQLIE